MRILVCGGRDYGVFPPANFPGDHHEVKQAEKERLFFLEAMKSHLECSQQTDGDHWWYTLEIISGMAKGADTLAVEYAKAYGLKLHEFPADWKRLGKAAGPIRNRQMLNEGKPDLVVAFPGGAGTAHMVSIAKVAGVEVIVYE